MTIQNQRFRFRNHTDVDFNWGINDTGTALQINGVDVTGTSGSVAVSHVDVQENTTDLGDAETIKLRSRLASNG